MRRARHTVWLVASLACGGSGSTGSPDTSGGAADASGSDASNGDPADAAQAAVDDAGVEVVKVVFATSSTHNGDLGGLAAADELCSDLAAGAGLDGAFKAWLSAPGEPAAERLSHADGPYVRTDGRRVADDWDDLVDGKLAARIDRDEDGAQVSGDVWTGTRASGQAADATCGGFDTSGDLGICGSTGATGGAWSDSNQPFCTSALRLYCLQQ
jgi:hypothetical protein